ncbi:hypothetical protein [Actinomadura hibisca]|uniref:hypothetical protein n=1 Tax=Actinomadura hibisca TaxID=68565 RepID=UPI0012FC0501|nr:hypothetical protein [Actinomadura hibisca]
MPSVLTRHPLRTTRAFLSPDHSEVDLEAMASNEGDERPFGYAYTAPWTGEGPGADPQAGSYDPESQTWKGPDGYDITAGYTSWTKTGVYGGDKYIDDHCA